MESQINHSSSLYFPYIGYISNTEGRKGLKKDTGWVHKRCVCVVSPSSAKDLEVDLNLFWVQISTHIISGNIKSMYGRNKSTTSIYIHTHHIISSIPYPITSNIYIYTHILIFIFIVLCLQTCILYIIMYVIGKQEHMFQCLPSIHDQLREPWTAPQWAVALFCVRFLQGGHMVMFVAIPCCHKWRIL